MKNYMEKIKEKGKSSLRLLRAQGTALLTSISRLPSPVFRLLKMLPSTASRSGSGTFDVRLRSSVSGLKRMLPSIRFATQGAALRTSNFHLRSSVSGLLVIMSFLISSVLFPSCEDVIDVKLSDENLNLIGVEASITTIDEPTVFLYKTLKVDQDAAYPGISGAVVSRT